jgi:hypothetical protein
MYYLVDVDHNGNAILQCISPQVTVKGFKKCCISDATDETDDDTSWNDSEEDGNRNECKEDKGTICEDGDSDTNW